ncbi:Hypothetical protein, putative [Bodo saltans]|uniref:Uncharacterized protein n=1 Tax=Bodo saltans TaxID=75058 RepID=A0A0S4IIC0_BODSA|nr:Hypothetical protein, putative [Bodo saltans]|eukprot:CUE71367.1 Hypothetical protein, putative [Bodo saltans]
MCVPHFGQPLPIFVMKVYLSERPPLPGVSPHAYHNLTCIRTSSQFLAMRRKRKHCLLALLQLLNVLVDTISVAPLTAPIPCMMQSSDERSNFLGYRYCPNCCPNFTHFLLS